MDKKSTILALALIVAGAYHENVFKAAHELKAAQRVAMADMNEK